MPVVGSTGYPDCPRCINNKGITWEQRVSLFIPSRPPGKLSRDLGQTFKPFIRVMFGRWMKINVNATKASDLRVPDTEALLQEELPSSQAPLRGKIRL